MLFIIQNDTVDGAQEEEEAEREETKLKSKRGEKRTNTQQQQDNTQQTSSGPSVTCKSPRSDPFVIQFGLGENEPHREKTGLRGFQPAYTQTGLYSHRRKLEA